ncbi:cupin domain-containing protein [Thauera sinica]|uniref:Cupin domain-containing protein n=1 Tax=Thauera sinica TaxID=2665146 RepID=A0ABW1ANL8_9RHOO|nr:cupin domain-containing protein [Thauera sp. K11]ATE61598.1 phosphoribosylaminoimidazole carboxylase [Thauera sp. K11]
MSGRGNLFAALPPPGAEERFDTLLDHPAARIERIASFGHASPPGFWYDQPGDEWVMLAAGRATLVLEHADGDRETLALAAGDWVFIPAHRRHRVESTSNDAIWLAVHPGKT